MAQIVLGIGTSHSPLLGIPPRLWLERAGDDVIRPSYFLADGRVVDYPQLLAEAGQRYVKVATAEEFERNAAEADAALRHLAATIERAQPDVLVVIGDDQNELFGTTNIPAVAVFTGDELVTYPKNEVNPDLPEWYREANRGYKMDTVHSHPGAPQLATALIEGLIVAGVEVAIAREVVDPRQAGFGHAFGFVIDRFCTDVKTPILPILLNTYFPPNVPRPSRCYDIGRIIAEVIAQIPGGQRVAVIASGGLTHFAVDEALDRHVIGAFRKHDAEALRTLPPMGLRSGNSEILNWIMAAGALEHLEVTESEYIPVHRTPAGTGVGLGFVTWERTGVDE